MEFMEKINKRFLVLFFLLASFALILGISFSRSDFFYEHIENFNPGKISLTLEAFIFVLFGYGLLMFSKNDKKLEKREIAVIILIFIFSFLIPPFLSRDVGAYLIGAKNLVWYHANAYLVNLDSISSNIWLKELGPVWWLKYPYPYGPLFLAIASISVLPNFAHLIGAVYSYKIIVLLAYILSIIIFSKITKELALNRFLILLYALNPAILINGLSEGHTEIFTILALLGSVYFFLIKKDLKSYFFWVAAVFVKYNALIFLPIFWKKNLKISLKNIILSSLFIFFAFLVVFGSFGFNLETAMNNFFIMKGQLQSCLYRCSPVISITDMIAGDYSGYLRMAIFSILYAYFFFRFIFRSDNQLKFIFWTYLALIFVFVRWVSPWYVLPVIPIGLMLEGKKYQILTFSLTAYSLLHFFGLF